MSTDVRRITTLCHHVETRVLSSIGVNLLLAVVLVVVLALAAVKAF